MSPPIRSQGIESALAPLSNGLRVDLVDNGCKSQYLKNYTRRDPDVYFHFSFPYSVIGAFGIGSAAGSFVIFIITYDILKIEEWNRRNKK